jgi:hypothetical protein
MNKELYNDLINYLKMDEDFYKAYVNALQQEINKAKSIVTDIVLNYINIWQDEEHLLKSYVKFITSFLENLFYETQTPLIDDYFMEYESVIKTIGITWIKLAGQYINIDKLYDDFIKTCKG